MVFSGEATSRGFSSRRDDFMHSANLDGWEDPNRAARDWKKLVLVIGLGALSWVATYIGMLELIESNMGELPLVHKAVIGFSVAMLMTMIIWLLDQMFAPIPAVTRLSYVLGYLFLTLISVGFGFGFYWKVLESRSEASRSAESAVGQVQSALHAASTRLTQLSATLKQLQQVSNEKAEIERTKGTSCPNSRPGDGPRRKLRDDDAQRFAFAAEFVKGRVSAVDSELKSLDGDLAKIASADRSTIDARSGTRNEFMRALGHKLDMTVTGFNAFRSDPQLKQIRLDLADRAERTTFPDSRGGTFACPDVQLQTALKGAVAAIDQLPRLEKPEIAAVEGSEATVEAFRRLTATFYGALSFKLPPSADELRDLQKKAVQSVENAPGAPRSAAAEQAGLSKRDYIPLAIAVFVDLCLLLVSMGRPMNRLHGLVPKMRAAERGPVIEILSRFNEIHRDPAMRENFEIFRHVVFDHHGAYYVAVPLDAPARMNPSDREALRLEAHLLANLFTSFEKERIFTRVLQPLITTSGIRKKLWRQGSKFAQAEAFRVYKFRDGAWPEIVLGAVMGAARRVEAEKRRRSDRTLGEPITETLSMAPGLATPHGFAVDDDARHRSSRIDGTAAAGQRMGSAATAETARETATSRRQAPLHPNVSRPAARVGVSTSSDLDQKFGVYARSAGDELANIDSAVFEEVELDIRHAPASDEASGSALAGDDDQRGQPAEVAARAANSNTAPRAWPAGRANELRRFSVTHDETGKVIALPGVTPQPQGQIPVATSTPNAVPPGSTASPADTAQHAVAKAGETIDVVLRRETATFTVPVSEAALPQPLARLLAQEVVTSQALAKPDQLELSLPATDKAPATGEIGVDAGIDGRAGAGPDSEGADLTPEDITLARRFAPPAAD